MKAKKFSFVPKLRKIVIISEAPSSASGSKQIFDAMTWKLPPECPVWKKGRRHHSLMCHIAEDGVVVVSVTGNS